MHTRDEIMPYKGATVQGIEAQARAVISGVPGVLIREY